MPNETEVAELWLAFKKGDKGAFNNLTVTYYRTLHNYGTKLTKDHALVDDCIQELFLDMWRRKEFLGDTDNVKFYLLKSLRRKIYIETKKRDKWQQESLDINEDLDFIGEFSIETKMIEIETNEEQHRKLHLILNSLSRRQREVIYLKFYQEMDYEQISKLMHINYQSVRNLVHTTIKEIKTAWFVD